MRLIVVVSAFAFLAAGCGGGADGEKGPSAQTLQSSAEVFERLLARETGQAAVTGGDGSAPIGEALRLPSAGGPETSSPPPAREADVSPSGDAAPQSPPPSAGPRPGTRFVTGKVKDVARDFSWVTAVFDASGAAAPSVGELAAVVERHEADALTPVLQRRKDFILGVGRVVSVQGDTVKVRLDPVSLQPRIKKGDDVVIRWF